MGWKRLRRWGAIALTLAIVAAVVAYAMSDNDCGRPLRGELMKAVVYCDYGAADVIRVEDVEKPVPGDDEILVRVRAASVNPLDWHYMRGTPYLMRMDSGLRKPEFTRLGVDYAGTVEAVGKNVTEFKPGDDVFGGRRGSLAEYVSARHDRAVVPKPASLTFEQAASVGVAAVTALQGLRDKGKLQPGQAVLVNGASGGVGTFAVQIAKAMGGVVTGVCSGRNAELVRSLGADRVIDYTKEDFTTKGERYDLVLDNVGNRSLLDMKRVLSENGKCVMIGGGGPNDGRWVGPMMRPVKGILLAPFVSQEFTMLLAELNKPDLAHLSELMQAGKVAPVIDRLYPLSEAAEAIRYLETGRARGKVIVTLP